MDLTKKITVYMQAYNAEKYLRQCLDSIVNQTYPINQFILVNDNSKDNTKEILEEYASKYDYITLMSYDNNKLTRYMDIIPEIAEGDYLTIIDADDWWEPDYLEKMVSFLEDNDLDLAVTGVHGYYETTKESSIARKLEKPLLLTQKEFADNYPQLWIYPSTNWGCLFKTDMYKSFDRNRILSKISTYGCDTVNTLEYIKLCKKIGIDNTALYHYRQHPQSVSCNYDSKRFQSNIGYYEFMKEFLESNNSFDSQKQEYLKRVHLGSLYMTMETLAKSKLSPEEKMEEAIRILSDGLTKYVCEKECEEKETLKVFARQIINENIAELIGTKHENVVLEFIAEFLPNCAKAFKFNLMPLFIKEELLWDAFVRDDNEKMLNITLDLIEKSAKYRREYDLPSVVKALIPEGTPVSDVKDEKFFNLYPGILKLVLALENTQALERMTEILFSGNELNCPEDFLNLYVTLAALENHAEAFIFGNIQKAYLFVDEKRNDEARQIVNDLVEMGLSDDENIVELQKMLNI